MDTDKSKDLENAFLETEKLFSMFDSVLRQDFSPKQKSKSDFSSVAQKIVNGNKTVLSEKPVPVKPKELLPASMSELEEKVKNCTLCRLCSTRKNVVFGQGCIISPLVMVIGEGPGENEDLTGLPFVGKAGAFLDKWLEAISLSRETNTYITNIVKCRPPENRDPSDDEKQACRDYLKMQIELLSPKAILCLGKPASSLILNDYDSSMSNLRGHFYFYDNSIPLICTYHPAAVLRDLTKKSDVWEDLKKLAKFLNLEIKTRK